MKLFRAFSIVITVIVLTGVWAGNSRSQSIAFDRYFVDKTMRVDYHITGTKGEEIISLDMVYEEGPWPGSRRNLIDTLNLGEFMVRVYDAATNAPIYTRGYSNIFHEWQTTEEALAGVYRTFHESVRIPFPRRAIQLTIAKRDAKLNFREIYSTVIDPQKPAHVNRAKKPSPFKVVPLMVNGPSHEKVDFLIVGDGYRKQDIAKFRNDAHWLNNAMFATSPFKERKKDFNVWLIEVISEEEGVSKPDIGVWKSSPLGTSYNALGTPRYILTEDNRAWRDIAAAAPYDFVHILVNDDRYGGGGIYNLYTTTYTKPDAPGKEWQIEYVYVHEIGHSFAALADEYYSSQVSYIDFYPKGIEPWEPNITRLLDPKHLKWRHHVSAETPIPTPWEKAAYDSLGRERMKLDRLAPDYYEKREPIYQAEQQILKTTQYAGRVGAFEGAGYTFQGMYRPSADCRMFSLSLVGFDPVCSEAMERVIDFYAR